MQLFSINPHSIRKNLFMFALIDDHTYEQPDVFRLSFLPNCFKKIWQQLGCERLTFRAKKIKKIW